MIMGDQFPVTYLRLTADFLGDHALAWYPRMNLS